MFTKIMLLAAATAGVARAQDQLPSDYWFVPEELTNSFCDGGTRPNWTNCADVYVDWFNSREVTYGPGWLEGQTMTVEDCQLRYVKCGGFEGQEFTQDDEMGLFGVLRSACESLGGGGVRRQGDLCVMVEDPANPFEPRSNKKRSIGAAAGSKRKAEPETKPQRSHARDLVQESKKLERRQGCEGTDACYGYDEFTFGGNIRGLKQNVCDSFIPNGGTCTETRSVTVEESISGTVGATVGFKDVIDISASFTLTSGSSFTTTISTTLPVDCPNGRGRVVWYPLGQVSAGQCTQGTCSDGLCQNLEISECSTWRPVAEDSGYLVGEYDIECS